MKFYICLLALCSLASLLLLLSLSPVDAGTRRFFDAKLDRGRRSSNPSKPIIQPETVDQKPPAVLDTQTNSVEQPTQPQPQPQSVQHSPAKPSPGQPAAPIVEPDVRLQFPSLQPMMFAEARTYQVLDDSADFTPYKSGDFHPVLSAHADKDPNADLNSMLAPMRETVEDPVLEETEEDDSNQVESEDYSNVSESQTTESAKDDEPVELSAPQQAAASTSKSGGEPPLQPEATPTVSQEMQSTLPAINPPQLPDLSIPEPRTTPMDKLMPEEPISPPETTTIPVEVTGIGNMTTSSSDSENSVANQTKPLQQTKPVLSNEQQLSTSDQESQTEPIAIDESVEKERTVEEPVTAQPEIDIIIGRVENSSTADTPRAEPVESSVVLKEISAPTNLLEKATPPSSVPESIVPKVKEELVEPTKPQSRLQTKNFEPDHTPTIITKFDTIPNSAEYSTTQAPLEPPPPDSKVEYSESSNESPGSTTSVPVTESTNVVSHDHNALDGVISDQVMAEEEESEPYDIATMLMWTVFCVICVTTLILTKWIFSSASSSSTGSIRVPEKLTKVEQEVVTKRNSLANLKENLGLDRTANLKEQAKRLKALNQRLVRRLERKSKLAPVKSALDTLKADLGDNIDDRISQRKLYIQNMKNLRSLLDKKNDLQKKIDQSRYEHLIMIRNFVRLEDLMDLMRDIEFNKVSNSLKESTFATRVETDFLREQISTFKDLVQKLSDEYDSLKKDIAEEKGREAFNEEELVKLKDLCDELDINDSVDDWKRRVADKEAETDKYYKDYINNYYRYIHDFSQQVQVS